MKKASPNQLGTWIKFTDITLEKKCKATNLWGFLNKHIGKKVAKSCCQDT